ncbi:hypothetical protein HY003_01255 [Candidatus Saccharibacteria bacterium]|nr:hypothetical protein [Candidatus Saccharibacteria bacterium]MBI3337905.1 hypothetical protein [Candidatus Saccharibacteria bacterium]
MKKKIIIGLVVVGMLALGYINLAIYPFRTQHPNFSDVERVFNKMQFPSDWQQISDSENRGIAGRACPVESESWCFHKSRTFRVESIDIAKIEEILKQSECPAVSTKESESTSGNKTVSLECSVKGLSINGSYNERKQELYFAARS